MPAILDQVCALLDQRLSRHAGDFFDEIAGHHRFGNGNIGRVTRTEIVCTGNQEMLVLVPLSPAHVLFKESQDRVHGFGHEEAVIRAGMRGAIQCLKDKVLGRQNSGEFFRKFLDLCEGHSRVSGALLQVDRDDPAFDVSGGV